SSRNAQAGRTIVRLQKPMAAGTRTHSEVATVTGFDADFDAPITSTVFLTAGSRSAATTGVQLRRNCRRCQSPVARRAIATPTPTAQARKTKSAQRPGMAIAGRRLPDTGADIPDVIIVNACRCPSEPYRFEACRVEPYRVEPASPADGRFPPTQCPGPRADSRPAARGSS